jgi:hypothetical protein
MSIYKGDIIMNDYYVYLYYRLDTNEPFYVGKGKGDRWKKLESRNNHFKRVVNKFPVAVEIVRENLTNEEACGIEIYLINELVFEYGFSIDICNNGSNEKGCHLCNQTWGGDGLSKPHTEEEIRKLSEMRIGEKNPMYGKNYRDYMTKEELRKYDEKRSKTMSGFNNPSAISVICLTTKKIFKIISDASSYYNIGISDISRCCKGYRMKKDKKVKVKSAGKLPDGTPLVWRYLNYKHNKTYRIIK